MLLALFLLAFYKRKRFLNSIHLLRTEVWYSDLQYLRQTLQGTKNSGINTYLLV